MVEQNLGKLYERSVRLSDLIYERGNLSKRIGRGRIRPHNSNLNANRIHHARERVSASRNRFTSELNEVNGRLEILAMPQAQAFREELESRRSALAELEELAKEGYVDESDLIVHRIQFKQLATRPQREPWLRVALAKLDEQKKEVKPLVSPGVSVEEKVSQKLVSAKQESLPAPRITINITVDLVERAIPKKPHELVPYHAMKEQVADLKALVESIHRGELEIPGPDKFLAPLNNDQKFELALRKLQGIIATTIAQEITNVGKPALQRKLAVQIGQLKYFLREEAQGTEIVVKAIQSLPTLQRMLVYSALSTSFKESLDHPDLDECSEEQLGEYLRNATWPIIGKFRNYAERVHHQYEITEASGDQIALIEKILATAAERSLDGDLDVEGVIDYLLSNRFPRSYFTVIMKIAEIGGFLDLAYRFFQENNATRVLAMKASRILNEDFLEDEK